MALVRRERHAFCDTALALGPDAPTLCGGWTARDLVAHLLVRENSMIGAVGITFSAMEGVTERAMARAARAPFPEMVKKLYDPLLRRLKAELWLDRERRGALTDVWH
jgi:uncharacterized protein (TIGR03083 family)